MHTPPLQLFEPFFFELVLLAEPARPDCLSSLVGVEAPGGGLEGGGGVVGYGGLSKPIFYAKISASSDWVGGGGVIFPPQPWGTGPYTSSSGGK